jgi:hypothetical protein
MRRSLNQRIALFALDETRNSMLSTKLKLSYNLSVIILILMTAQSVAGLLWSHVYRDNTFVRSAWKGNDLVTLFVAVPVLAAALFFARRGSVRAQLIWMGVLDYALYNYAFYLLGAAFNAFFLLYAVLLGLAIFALLFGLIHLDVNRMREAARDRMPVKWIGGYFLFVALGLSAVYLIQSIRFIFTGDLPAIVTMTGHPTSVVFALDLTLLVPWLVLAAIWLIKRQPWGYILTGILSVKGPIYTLILTASSFVALNAGIASAADEIPLWATLTLLGGIASTVFYVNIQE